MSFEEFQQLARLYTIGALDRDEQRRFNAARLHFGAEAEEFLEECQKLNAILALSLLPSKPSASAKARLMARIRENADEAEMLEKLQDLAAHAPKVLPFDGPLLPETLQLMISAMKESEVQGRVYGPN